LAEHPDIITTKILKSLVAAIAEQTSVPAETTETAPAEPAVEKEGEEKETEDSGKLTPDID
jgi:hypothetical protein